MNLLLIENDEIEASDSSEVLCVFNINLLRGGIQARHLGSTRTYKLSAHVHKYRRFATGKL